MLHQFLLVLTASVASSSAVPVDGQLVKSHGLWHCAASDTCVGSGADQSLEWSEPLSEGQFIVSSVHKASAGSQVCGHSLNGEGFSLYSDNKLYTSNGSIAQVPHDHEQWILLKSTVTPTGIITKIFQPQDSLIGQFIADVKPKQPFRVGVWCLHGDGTTEVANFTVKKLGRLLSLPNPAVQMRRLLGKYDICDRNGYWMSYHNLVIYSRQANNLDCYVVVDGGSDRIKVTFSGTSENLYDHVYLYDGWSSSSTLIASLSGSVTGTFTSTGRYLTLRWVTDHTMTNYYWTASFGSYTAAPTQRPSYAPAHAPTPAALPTRLHVPSAAEEAAEEGTTPYFE